MTVLPLAAGDTERFHRVEAFCERYALDVPELVRVAAGATVGEAKACLVCAPGAGAPALFEALTGMRVGESDLHETIAEANGISMALCGVIERDARKPVEEWLERVALPIFVTPASAVLGTAEVELLRELTAAGREVAVVILGLECEPDRAAFLREIDEFKLSKVRRELNVAFPVFVDMPNLGAAAAELQQWIAARLQPARLRQFDRIVDRWLCDLATTVRDGLEQDRLREQRLAHVEEHLRQWSAQSGDTLARERANVENALHAGTLQQADAPSSLVRAVNARLGGDIAEFCAAYADVVTLFPFEPIEARPRPDAQLPDLAGRVDTVLTSFAQSISAQIESQRAQMQWQRADADLRELA